MILGWDSPPFVIPEKLLHRMADQGTSAHQAWAERVAQTPEALRREFERRNEGKLPHGWRSAIAAARQDSSGTARSSRPARPAAPCSITCSSRSRDAGRLRRSDAVQQHKG